MARKTYTSPAVKARWNRKHYDRMAVLVPKGKKEIIQKYAKEHNLSMNAMIAEMLRCEIGLTELEWKRQGSALPAEERKSR